MSDVLNLDKNMAPIARVGEDEEAAETQQHSFTEEDVSQMHEAVRELAQQVLPKEELEGELGKLDSTLQEISDLHRSGGSFCRGR